MKLAIALTAVRILDVFTTHYHVSRYGYVVEGNPVTRSLMQFSYPLYLISNLVVSLLMSCIVYRYRDNRVVEVTGFALLVISLVAVFINFLLVIM